MKKILLPLLFLTLGFSNCKSNKSDDTVKNLFILNTLQNASKTPTYDWNYITVPNSYSTTSLIVAQSKFWITANTDFGYNASKGYIFSSTNGITWTQSSYSGEPLWDIKYLNNQFVAVGGGGSSKAGGIVYTSPDGTTWTKQATISNTIITVITSISGNSSYYTISGYGGTSPNYYARSISTDLVNWTHFVTTNSSLSGGSSFPAIQTTTTTAGASVISSNSSFIISCPGTCTTSGNWAISTIDTTSISQQYLRELNGTAVIYSTTSSSAANIYYSVNGAAFTKVTNFTAPVSTLGLSVIDNKFVIPSVANSGTSNQISFSYSSDGINWKSTTVSMSEGSGSLSLALFASLNGTYVASNGSRIFYTTSKSITFP
jgi:hypothetical protein